MTENSLHEQFEDELLSAYVDGELTPAERAAVEKRLSDDPQAQAMVAELRAVCETLKSLPKQELGTDLRESVLRQAVVLAEPGPSALGGARRWAWAVMALAAALLLAV
jgi:anti-sigma factor RsiW